MTMFMDHSVKYIYIIDHLNRFCGVVSSHEMTAAMLNRKESVSQLAADFLLREFHVLTQGMSLSEALQLFLAHQGERLPVIDSIENPVLLGAVYKSSILDTYYKLHQPLV